MDYGDGWQKWEPENDQRRRGLTIFWTGETNDELRHAIFDERHLKRRHQPTYLSG